MAMKKSTKNRKAFSLAEAMMATVVLSIAAAGVLLPFVSGAAVQAEGAHRTLAAKLASDLMEEIISTPFNNIITEYGTYTETQGHIIRDFDTGVEFTDPMYANFSRDVSCEEVYVPQESGAEESKFIRATVRVRYNGNEIVSLSRLISK